LTTFTIVECNLLFTTLQVTACATKNIIIIAIVFSLGLRQLEPKPKKRKAVIHVHNSSSYEWCHQARAFTWGRKDV